MKGRRAFVEAFVKRFIKGVLKREGSFNRVM